MAHRTLIVLLLLFARSAFADTEHDWPRWQRGYVYAFGVEEIGNLAFIQGGIELHASVRATPRLRIAGTGALNASQRDRPDGTLAGGTYRALGGVEWELMPPHDGIFVQHVAAVGGIGGELTLWQHGMASRPLVYGGVEVTEGFTFDQSDFFHGIRSLSFRFGLRVTAAPAVPRSRLPLRCAGPCGAIDREGPLDLGAMFYFGLDFGR